MQPFSITYDIKSEWLCFAVNCCVVFRCVFYIFLQPVVLFPQHMQDVFFCRIAVAFVGQHHVTYGTAMAFDGIIKPFALYREGTLVIVQFTVYQQQRCLDLMRVGKGTHLVVQLGSAC